MPRVDELDRCVFERLPPLTPFWMDGEGKWLVMYPTEWEYEVERFGAKDDAYAFATKLRTAGEPHEQE